MEGERYMLKLWYDIPGEEPLTATRGRGKTIIIEHTK